MGLALVSQIYVGLLKFHQNVVYLRLVKFRELSEDGVEEIVA